MKCNECNYANGYIDGSDIKKVQCDITDEVHVEAFECNCEYSRLLRDKEARIMNDKAVAEETLMALRNKISKPIVNPQRVIDILTDTTKEAGTKITEAIEYLEDFV